MKGNLLISNRDAWVDFGVMVENGDFGGLITPAVFKNLKSINWRDENGIEYDLTSPVLASRTFSINFYCNDANKLNSFFAFINSQNSRIWEFAEINRVYTLRILKQTDIKIRGGKALFTLEFSDDNPMFGYGYLAPLSSNEPALQKYLIDGIDLAKYGIITTDGFEDKVAKEYPIKNNINIDSALFNGIIYPQQNIYFDIKSLSLPLFMRAKDLTELWRNFDALVYNLTKPKERVFTDTNTGKKYPFVYKGITINRFFPTGKIWLEFNLNIEFTDLPKTI